DTAIPTPVEDGDLAFFGAAIPKTPQVVVPPLLVPRRGDRPDLVAAGVHLSGQPFDDASLPSGIPTLEHDDGALFSPEGFDLQAEELPLDRAYLLVVISFAVELCAKVYLIEAESTRGVNYKFKRGQIFSPHRRCHSTGGRTSIARSDAPERAP